MLWFCGNFLDQGGIDSEGTGEELPYHNGTPSESIIEKESKVHSAEEVEQANKSHPSPLENFSKKSNGIFN